MVETPFIQVYYSQGKGKRLICFSMDNDLKVNQLFNQDSYNRTAIQSGWL